MKDWLGLVVAVVALVQPWLLYLYRQYMERATRDVFPIGEMEIGFSGLGSTLAVGGTVLANNRPQVIRNFEMTVARQGDGAARVTLWWLVSRASVVSGSVVQGLQNQVSFTPRQALYIKPEEPQRFEVLFVDKELMQTIQTLLLPVRQEWMAITDAEREQALADRYQDFARRPAVVSFLDEVAKHLLWRQGTYRIELTLRVQGGRSLPSTYAYTVSISAEEEALLLTNLTTALHECLTGQITPYQFVYKEYPQNASGG